MSAIDGLVFDLDNTLLDRQSVFARVAESFYDEHLQTIASVAREEAVAMMARWDGDGYSDREEMRSAVARRVAGYRAGHGIAGGVVRLGDDTARGAGRGGQWVLLAQLNDRRVPWGIVTNGRTMTQRGKCRAAGLEQLAPFIIVSEEAGYEKPDPRIFRDALAATGTHGAGMGHVRGGQPGGRHRRGQALWDEGSLDQAGYRQYPAGLLPPDHAIDHVLEVRSLVGM